MSDISLCIPCDYKHIRFLKSLIYNIIAQTILPQEVIISISGYNNNNFYDHSVIKNILYEKGISLIIVNTKRVLAAGINRNIAINLANYSIISFIDADDLMVANRLEIIKKIFKNNNVEVLLHHFTSTMLFKNKDNVSHNNLDKTNHNNTELRNITLKDISIEEYNPEFLCHYSFSFNIHYGHPSLRKNIAKNYFYSTSLRGQDVEYISQLLNNNIKIYEYKKPLTFYRPEHSTILI